MRGWLVFSVAFALVLAVRPAGDFSAHAQDDAPKPSVTVNGTANYLGKPRDSIVVTLTKIVAPTPANQDPKADEAKPATSTTNAKGEFEFPNVAIGKYRLTAQGRPANSIRAYKESDPVDIEVTADTKSPLTKTITLTLDKAR